jgi:outer membrane protein
MAVAVLLLSGCTPKSGTPTNTSSGGPEGGQHTLLGASKSGVAELDPSQVYKLSAYTDLNKKLDDEAKKMADELQGEVKAHKVSQDQLAVDRLKMQEQLNEERAKAQNPLNDKVSHIIADIAKEKGYTVVLDKRIVVTGVDDITDEVKNRFEKNQVSSGTPAPGDQNSGVGYVNEDTISDLKMFHDAQGQLQQYYQKLQQEYQKKEKSLSAVQKGDLEKELADQFNGKKAALFGPLQDKVHTMIAQVAKDQNLSLVLDTQQVMWGGKNITTDVIAKLVKTNS